MTWKPALPRYSATMPARRESSSIRRVRSPTNMDHVYRPPMLVARRPRGSTAMPAGPGAAVESRHPIRDLVALLRIEHLGGVGHRLGDALARGFRERDLIGPQPLDCTTIDGGGGQERDRLAARGLGFLVQRAQVVDGALGDAGDLDLLIRAGVEL